MKPARPIRTLTFINHFIRKPKPPGENRFLKARQLVDRIYVMISNFGGFTMIQCLYTVFDVLAEEGGPVFQAKNDGVALRNFHNIIQSQALNPGDYQLFRLARYDTESLDLTLEKSLVKLNKVLESEVKG
jgi:hypothetical protein